MTGSVFHHLGAPASLPAGQQLLGAVVYGEAGVMEAQAPVLPVAAPVLDGAAAIASALTCGAPLRDGCLGPVSYRCSEELIFGVVALDEAAAGGLAAATATAYAAIFAALDAEGYPTLLRAWNYLPHINAETDGLERYRQFNAGRQQAFAASARPLAGKVPAACALGTAEGMLSIAFLGSVTPFVPVENPRQVSAYHYPPEYGERSPTFSRAGLTRIGGRDVLFISGTAAIVGHSSLHCDDVLAQTDETLVNLAAVLSAAAAYPGAPRYRMAELDYTVYVRQPDDALAVLARVREAVGPAARVVCVQADVCRAELLVEIEAVGGLSQGAPA
jgi:enamine deaminase RidA (YjgF/YER057c/UK114 family)